MVLQGPPHPARPSRVLDPGFQGKACGCVVGHPLPRLGQRALPRPPARCRGTWEWKPEPGASGLGPGGVEREVKVGGKALQIGSERETGSAVRLKGEL